MPLLAQLRIDNFMLEYISTAEAARRLGISRRRVQSLILEDRLLADRVGRTYAVYVPSVEALVRFPPWHQRTTELQAIQLQWEQWEAEQAEWEQAQAESLAAPENVDHMPERLDQQPNQPEEHPPGCVHE